MRTERAISNWFSVRLGSDNPDPDFRSSVLILWPPLIPEFLLSPSSVKEKNFPSLGLKHVPASNFRAEMILSYEILFLNT